VSLGWIKRGAIRVNATMAMKPPMKPNVMPLMAGGRRLSGLLTGLAEADAAAAIRDSGFDMAILRVSYARARALDWHPHVHVRNDTNPSPIFLGSRIFAKTGHPTTHVTPRSSDFPSKYRFCRHCIDVHSAHAPSGTTTCVAGLRSRVVRALFRARMPSPRRSAAVRRARRRCRL
jgi:hypothetical protein